MSKAEVVIVLSLASLILLSIYLEESRNDTTPLTHKEQSAEPGNYQSVLQRASDNGKNLILSSLNKAWATEGGLLDHFLASFRSGNNTMELLRNLVLVALDASAYSRCIAVHKHCIVLETEGVDFSSQEALFMSADFVKMMRRRIEFLGEILQLGYNFIFTDLDVLWFRNPWDYLSKTSDIEVSCDVYRPETNNSVANTGFVHVRSNARTIEVYKFWLSQMIHKHPNKNEQQVFNEIKSSAKFGARVTYLATSQFSNFGDLRPRDMETIVTMHANCCKGMAAKLADLKLTVEDWQEFVSSPPRKKEKRRFRFRAPDSCKRSWKM